MSRGVVRLNLAAGFHVSENIRATEGINGLF